MDTAACTLIKLKKKGALMQVMDKIIITIEPSGCRWGKVGRPGKCINTLSWPAGSQN